MCFALVVIAVVVAVETVRECGGGRTGGPSTACGFRSGAGAEGARDGSPGAGRQPSAASVIHGGGGNSAGSDTALRPDSAGRCQPGERSIESSPATSRGSCRCREGRRRGRGRTRRRFPDRAAHRGPGTVDVDDLGDRDRDNRCVGGPTRGRRGAVPVVEVEPQVAEHLVHVTQRRSPGHRGLALDQARAGDHVGVHSSDEPGPGENVPHGQRSGCGCPKLGRGR